MVPISSPVIQRTNVDAHFFKWRTTQQKNVHNRIHYLEIIYLVLENIYSLCQLLVPGKDKYHFNSFFKGRQGIKKISWLYNRIFSNTYIIFK